MNNRFKKLNRKAKRAFVSLLSVAVICTTSGVGTIFAEAGEVAEDVNGLESPDTTNTSTDTDGTIAPQSLNTEEAEGVSESVSNNSEQADNTEPEQSEDSGEAGSDETTDSDYSESDADTESQAADSETETDTSSGDGTTSDEVENVSDSEEITEDSTEESSETTSDEESADGSSEESLEETSEETSTAATSDSATETTDDTSAEQTDATDVETIDDVSDDYIIEPEALNTSASDVSFGSITATYDNKAYNLVTVSGLDSTIYDVTYSVVHTPFSGTAEAAVVYTNTIPTGTKGGTYVITIDVTNKTVNTDTNSVTLTSTISKSVTASMMEFTTGETTYEYTGSSIEPGITVKDTVNGEEVTLTSGTDYTVSYSNNTDVAPTTSASPPTVTITGKGNYNGTASLLFNIGNAQSSTVAAIMYSGTYDKASHPVCQGVTYDASEVSKVTYSLDGGEETTTIPTVTDAGSYPVVIRFYGKAYVDTSVTPNINVVYCDKTLTQNCTITAKDMGSSTISVSMSTSYAYTGSAIEPVVVVSDGGTTLTRGVDYTTTYSNNINPASGSDSNPPTVVITGMGNYSGTLNKTFTIVDFSDQIEIWYNNKSTKLDWYTKKVNITAPGYTISTSASGSFSSKYTISSEGLGSGADLYFKNSSTGVVSPAIAVSVNIDMTSPTGKITVNDYSSKSINESTDVAFYTQDQKVIKIKSNDKLSGVDTVQYYIGSKQLLSNQAIEKAASDEWATYDADNKPKLKSNNVSFVYAKITDVAGNIAYISTKGIINDTEGPTVTSLSEAVGEDGSFNITVTANDDLTGVAKYYLVYYKKDEAPEKDPENTAVQSNGLSTEDGKFVITLDGGTTYIYYAVAEDNAGNIGEVYKKDGTRKASGSESSSSSSSSSGLDPVPNGIAGGGSSSAAASGSGAGASAGAAPGSSAGSKSASASGTGSNSSAGSKAANVSGAGSSTSSGYSGSDQTSIANAEIKRDPYISDATGDVHIGEELTDGWSNIAKEVIAAEEGTRISVDMRGTSTVPVQLFEALQSKDVSVTLEMPENYKWTINGKSISSIPTEDMDMRIVSGSRNIPSSLINEMADVYPHYDFEIKHNGDFGFTATLSLNVNSANSGMYGNLFYYDADKGELELIDSQKANDDGVVSYDLTHASDYTVIVKAAAMTEAAPEEEVELGTTGTIIDYTTSDYSMKTGAVTGQGKFSDLRNWLFIIAIISMILGISLLFVPSLQDKKDEMFGDL